MTEYKIIIVNKPGLFSQNNISEKYDEIHILINNVTISSSAFINSQQLKYIKFADDTKLSTNSFYNCINLKIDKLPLIKSIPVACFMNCKNIIKIEIPNTVMEIEQSAFKNSGLECITLNNGLRFIDKFAFAGTNIRSIILPKTILRIDETCFSNCNHLYVIYYYYELTDIISNLRLQLNPDLDFKCIS